MAAILPTFSRLLQLPDELLLGVLDYIHEFPLYQRTRSLHGLSLVNRRFHRLANPYLYSTFSFHACVPYLFLRSICLNPDLGALVKVVRWDYNSQVEGLFIYEPGVLAVKQQFYLETARNKLQQKAAQGDGVAKQLVANLTLGRLYLGDQRALDVLLMFVPNIERLEVIETYRWDDHIYWFLPILCRPRSFSRLSSASIQGPMRSQNITALALLPTMRQLELGQVIEVRQELGRTFQWENAWPMDIIGPGFFDFRSSKLENMSLIASYTGLQDVLKLLKTTPALTSFSYEHQENDLSPRHLEVPYDSLVKLFEHHRLTLKIIRVTITNVHDLRAPPPLGGEILFKTVQDFPQLTQLELFLSSTQGSIRAPNWALLPPSLEELTIDHHGARDYTASGTTKLEQGLMDLAARKQRGELPKLSKLLFSNWHPFYGTFPQDLSVRDLLKEVDIHLNSVPATMGTSAHTMEDIGWVELQSEPDWVIVETYRLYED